MSKGSILIVGAGSLDSGLGAAVAAHLKSGGMVVIDEPRPQPAARPSLSAFPIPKMATPRDPNPTPCGPRQPRWRRR